MSIISPFVDQLMRFIAKCRTKDGSELDIEIVLREALANAIVYGDQEILDKRVYVTCRCTTGGKFRPQLRTKDKGLTVRWYWIRPR